MGSKRVAILQSAYIPWKGYFDLIRSVDEFVLYDDTQFTRRDWRSRNRIMTAQGPRWLSIPVEVKGRFHQRIDETVVADPDWHAVHWDTLHHAYARARHFPGFAPVIREAYAGLAGERSLSRINHRLLQVVCTVLGIATPITWSSDYPRHEGRSERLLGICKAAGAGVYLSGPAARAYLDVGLFARAGVEVVFADYAGYPEYPQGQARPFEHGVTVLDLLFRTGPDALSHMKPLA